MIIPIAYIVYRFFKKYPFAIAIFVMMYTCNIYNIEKEIGEEERIEVNINNYAIEQCLIDNVIPTKTITYSHINNIKNKQQNYQPLYIKSAYHKLFILYQNLAIDKNNHKDFT